MNDELLEAFISMNLSIMQCCVVTYGVECYCGHITDITYSAKAKAYFVQPHRCGHRFKYCEQFARDVAQTLSEGWHPEARWKSWAPERKFEN